MIGIPDGNFSVETYVELLDLRLNSCQGPEVAFLAAACSWLGLIIKKVWRPEIILVRKYNMILNVKDAGVNQKRKPSFVLYIIVVCMAKTKTNKATL